MYNVVRFKKKGKAVKENMKNKGNQLYATGKQLYTKTMIFSLYRITLLYFKGVFFIIYL